MHIHAVWMEMNVFGMFNDRSFKKKFSNKKHGKFVKFEMIYDY